MLVPKPDHTWRMVIDYRLLNKADKKMGWPIPNIKDLLNRIGSREPTVFGKIDCTKGYHQILAGE
jgi:hypothetical protein